MASVIARAYVNCIKRGIRKIDDVRPDKLKEEVVGLLVAEGLYDLAGVENPESNPAVEEKEDKPIEDTADKEPINDKPKEDKEV